MWRGRVAWDNSYRRRRGRMRRIAIWALLAVLACLALAAAPLANAQAPTIVTNITFPEGEFLGTFTASAPLCPSGTFPVDQFVGGGGAFDNAHVSSLRSPSGSCSHVQTAPAPSLSSSIRSSRRGRW